MTGTSALFLDASNLYHCINKKYSGARLDFAKVKTLFANLKEAYVYAACENGQADNFIRMLKRFDYIPRIKKPRTVSKGIKKANCDIDIVVDVMSLYKNIDNVILGTADGDFKPLIKHLNKQGRRTIVFGCNVSRELYCASEVIEIWRDILV